MLSTQEGVKEDILKLQREIWIFMAFSGWAIGESKASIVDTWHYSHTLHIPIVDIERSVCGLKGIYL